MLSKCCFTFFLQLLYVIDEASIAIDFELLLLLNFLPLLLSFVLKLTDKLVYLCDFRRCLIALLYAVIQLISELCRDSDSAWIQKVNISLL